MINTKEQCFKGVLADYLGVNFMNGQITEWPILEHLTISFPLAFL